MRLVAAPTNQTTGAFGDVVAQAPFLVNPWKHKISATAPTLAFRMGVLLVNFKKCCVGSNANTYFDTPVMDAVDYYNMRT